MAPPAPRLTDIRPADLADPARADELRRQAVARGLIGPSEHDRARFHAAVAHARRCGTINAPGLLAAILRRGLWRFLSQADEDAAKNQHARNRPLGPEIAGRAGRAIPSSDDPTTASRAPSSLATVLRRLPGPRGAASFGDASVSPDG